MSERLYAFQRIIKLFREAGVHGGYRTVLKREGIRPVSEHGIDNACHSNYYRAAEVDSFLKMVRL